MLHDALVEGEIRDEPLHPTSALGEGWDAEVGCFASHVLGVYDSTYSLVELWTTIAGTYDEWLANMLAKGFEDFGAEGFDIGYYLCMLWVVRIKRVFDAISACGS